MQVKIWSLLFLIMANGVFGQTVDESIEGTFSNPTTLTDKQMDGAQNFTHQGIRDREYLENCKKIDDCKDEEGFPLEMMIGKAYAILGVVAGGGGLPTLTKPAAKAGATAGATATAPATATATATAPATATASAPATDAAKAAEKDTSPDYCMIVAMANETFGSLIQQSLQNKDDNKTSEGDAQLQALMSLRKTHETRKKTSTLQAGIYTAVTACYGVMLATGKAAADWKFIAKMGGAAALSALYWKKMVKHKNAVKTIEEIMASMEFSGKNCNPWTKTTCFCQEATSKELYPNEYQEVCVLNQGNFDIPKISLGCAAVDANKITYDKECKCKLSNTCMKTDLKAYNPKFGLGNNLMDDVNKSFNLLNDGDMDVGRLNEARLNSASMVAKMKIKPVGKFPNPKLTNEQKKLAEALSPYMPSALANLAAASNTNYQGGIKEDSGAAAISKLSSSVKSKLAEAIKIGYKSGGGYAATEESELEMPMMPGMGAANTNNAEILTFAEAAISKADVSNTPETPIFDIISNRYRRSGWEKLDRFEK